MSELDLERLRAQTEADWHELRSRRVLEAIRAELDGPGLRVLAPPPRRRRGVGVAIGLSAAAASLALLLLQRSTPPEPGPSPVALRPEPEAMPAPPAPPPPLTPRLGLGSGSFATPDAHARVEVQSIRPDELVVRQRGGSVRYEIDPAREREFRVVLRGVEVRVEGTIFTVHDRDEVEVEVERGVVLVRHRGGRTRLRVSESGHFQRRRPPPRRPPEPPAALPSEPPPPPTHAESMRDAREARRKGHLQTARDALRAAIDAAPGASERGLAYYELALLEEQARAPAAAAAAFATAHDVGGASFVLREEALVGELRNWLDAGRSDEAARARALYLRRHPHGAYLDRVRTATAAKN